LKWKMVVCLLSDSLFIDGQAIEGIFDCFMIQEIAVQGAEIVPQQIIESKILFIRGKKVMLDKDLAVLFMCTDFQLMCKPTTIFERVYVTLLAS